jgi:hypothetical protein
MGWRVLRHSGRGNILGLDGWRTVYDGQDEAKARSIFETIDRDMRRGGIMLRRPDGRTEMISHAKKKGVSVKKTNSKGTDRGDSFDLSERLESTVPPREESRPPNPSKLPKLHAAYLKRIASDLAAIQTAHDFISRARVLVKKANALQLPAGASMSIAGVDVSLHVGLVNLDYAACLLKNEREQAIRECPHGP